MKQLNYSPEIVANTILLRNKKLNSSNLTPMKLQKLLYIVYKECLSRYELSLFPEKFEGWRFGPVMPSVYYEFKSFGDKEINEFVKDAEGNAYVLSEEMLEINNLIDVVLVKFKDTSAVDLANLTHKNVNSAWLKAIHTQGKYFPNDAILEEKSYLV